MKPAPFAYWRPETVDEALLALSEAGHDAKVLAGGQSLLPMLNMRLARPGVVVDINRVPGLQDVSRPNERTLITGALVRQRALEQYAFTERALSLFQQALSHVGHPQTRNRGTLGGSLVHGDPAAELPVLLAALGGWVTLKRRGGARTVDAASFFLAPMVTAIEPDELLTDVAWRLPPPHSATVFEEFQRRRGDFAIVAVAVVMQVSSDGRVTELRGALGGVGDVPQPLRVASLLGSHPDPTVLADLAADVVRDLDPPADVHATAEFRRQLARVLLRRSLERAYREARRLTNEGSES
jgi:CO/xanthine dehydrogenase FAD-binding subunit